MARPPLAAIRASVERRASPSPRSRSRAPTSTARSMAMGSPAATAPRTSSVTSSATFLRSASSRPSRSRGVLSGGIGRTTFGQEADRAVGDAERRGRREGRPGSIPQPPGFVRLHPHDVGLDDAQPVGSRGSRCPSHPSRRDAAACPGVNSARSAGRSIATVTTRPSSARDMSTSTSIRPQPVIHGACPSTTQPQRSCVARTAGGPGRRR